MTRAKARRGKLPPMVATAVYAPKRGGEWYFSHFTPGDSRKTCASLGWIGVLLVPTESIVSTKELRALRAVARNARDWVKLEPDLKESQMDYWHLLVLMDSVARLAKAKGGRK